MMKLVQCIKKEIVHLIPPVIYFAICFNLFHYAQTLLMRAENIHFTSYIGATLGALLAGKVILVVDNLPCINAFPNKPIIYNISWKFMVYSFFVISVQIVDEMIEHFYHTKNGLITYNYIKTILVEPRFWGIQIFVLMSFLVFIAFTELERIIGQTKMKKIFFG